MESRMHAHGNTTSRPSPRKLLQNRFFLWFWALCWRYFRNYCKLDCIGKKILKYSFKWQICHPNANRSPFFIVSGKCVPNFSEFLLLTPGFCSLGHREGQTLVLGSFLAIYGQFWHILRANGWIRSFKNSEKVKKCTRAQILAHFRFIFTVSEAKFWI